MIRAYAHELRVRMSEHQSDNSPCVTNSEWLEDLGEMIREQERGEDQEHQWVPPMSAAARDRVLARVLAGPGEPPAVVAASTASATRTPRRVMTPRDTGAASNRSLPGVSRSG